MLYSSLHVSDGCARPALFYGQPKIHKDNVPLRPIVSNVGTATYPTAQYLAKILANVSGKTDSHVKNSGHFIEKIKEIKLAPDECLVSFDVKSLFTSVPLKRAIEVTRQYLKNDTSWRETTTLKLEEIIDLMTLCLENNSFKFRDEFYEMSDGLAMGSPLSPVLANLFMEDLEC